MLLRLVLPVIVCFSHLWLSGRAVSLDKRSHQDGDLKLIDGPAPTMGTVLVYRGYGWGRICDDHWSMREAQVVCRQLGMGHALEAHRRNRYASKVVGSYLMDEVHCTGREERLVDCQFLGWGVHDCKQNEEVGVKCSYEAPVKLKPAWNPLQLELNQTVLEKMAKVGVELVHPKHLPQRDGIPSFYPVLVELEDGTQGSVCADHFKGAEAIVYCRQIGAGNGGRTIPMPQHHTGVDRNSSIAIVGFCYGNETSVSDCKTYADSNGVLCKSNMAAAVECVQDLPDLVPDPYSLESSSYMQRMSLWLLECALEENCLPDTVYQIIDRNPGNYAWMTRTLLRFSSVIENIGTAAFKPLEEPENWEWHACHMHYHSMKVFSRYEVVDPEQRLVSVGLKASFCLEDNICQSGVTPVYRCSNVIDSKGTQGITPGCRDMYLHDYDCQWVDITDVAPGKYTFQVPPDMFYGLFVIPTSHNYLRIACGIDDGLADCPLYFTFQAQVSFNPDFLVAESNYFNNALVCELTHMGHHAVLRSCRYSHPNDLV